MHLPNGWKLSTIGSMADTIMGYAFKSNDFVDHGIPLIRMGNLYQNQLQLDRSPVFLPEHFLQEYERFTIKRGDLVMSMTGTMGKRDYGFTVQIPVETPICLLNQRVMKIIPKKLTSREYLLNLLRSEQILSKLYSFPGGTKQANLSSQQVLELPTLIPPFPEQEKIAQILCTWDKAIEKLEALIAAKRKRKKVLMQQLLTGKKRFAGFAEEWQSVRLAKLLKEEKARNKDSLISRVLSVTNRSGFVLPEEQFSRQVASSDLSNYKIVRKGQFGYNPSRINVGSFARLDSYEVGVLSPMYVVFSIGEQKLNSDFFLNWMSSHEAKQRIVSSTQGTVRDSVGFDALSSFHIKVPTIAEQQKIASILTVADAEIETHQKQLAALKEQKKGLMQQLLTGKKRVKVDGHV